MAQSDDDYRTLKPAEGADDRYGTLAPPRQTPAPPKRPAPRPAPPVEPTLQPQAEAAPAAAGAPKPAPRPPAEAIRLTTKLARPFCRLFPLSEEAGRLLDEKQTLLVYLYRLMNERLFVDAVRLLAHALPPRDGIRWAADCAKRSAGSAPAAAALASAAAWLTDPDEPRRRACGEAAAAAGCATAAGAAALAVFLSGGSIAPAGRPAAAPGEHLTSRAVANAVILAALAGERGKTAERYFQDLKEGIALATGAGRSADSHTGADR